MEAVARPARRRQVSSQRAQRQPRFDHGVPAAVQRAGRRRRPRRGCGRAPRRARGTRWPRRPPRAAAANASMTARSASSVATVSDPLAPEADAGHRRADLLPAAPGALRHVELVPRTPATDPDETEVAHRRTGGRGIGLEVIHPEPGLHELDCVPGADDAAADDHGARRRRGRPRRLDATSRPSPGVTGLTGAACTATTGWRRPPPTGAVVPEDGAAGHEHVGARSGRHRRRRPRRSPRRPRCRGRAPPASTAARTCATFAMTSAMKLWPPKPGKTVMHRTRSTSPR